jgi:hypothetical protein
MRFTDISLAVLAAAHPATSTPLQWAKRQFGGFPGFGGGGGGAVSGEITVDLTKTYQKMDGFGFSLAFQRANLITNNPSEKNRDELMDLLFSTEKGAGFSILRNGIGSSLTSESDWMNTFAPDNPGSPTAEPTYKWDGKDSGQLWVAKTAVEKYGLKYVYGNAWSPPFYMKVSFCPGLLFCFLERYFRFSFSILGLTRTTGIDQQQRKQRRKPQDGVVPGLCQLPRPIRQVLRRSGSERYPSRPHERA